MLDKTLGEKLILVIEDVAQQLDISTLKETLKSLKELSKYEIPKEIYCVPFFKETPTGKVKRREILKNL